LKNSLRVCQKSSPFESKSFFKLKKLFFKVFSFYFCATLESLISSVLIQGFIKEWKRVLSQFLFCITFTFDVFRINKIYSTLVLHFCEIHQSSGDSDTLLMMNCKSNTLCFKLYIYSNKIRSQKMLLFTLLLN
jgi:hypothetical protein